MLARPDPVVISEPLFETSEDEDLDDPFGFAAMGFDNEPAAAPVAAAASPTANAHVGPAEALPVAIGPWPSSAHESHSVTRIGHVIWCRRCGRHAAVRLGVGLLKPCCGLAAGAHLARIARLQVGRHPVSGDPL